MNNPVSTITKILTITITWQKFQLRPYLFSYTVSPTHSRNLGLSISLRGESFTDRYTGTVEMRQKGLKIIFT